jgi:DNA-binding Xre family transcriptional regulator
VNRYDPLFGIALEIPHLGLGDGSLRFAVFAGGGGSAEFCCSGTAAALLASGTGCALSGALSSVPFMAKQVRLTLAKAIAKANLRRAEAGERPITMNGLVVAAGVAATTITRLARNDEKAASALSLDLASRIVTVLDCGIEDVLEVVVG